MADPLLRLVNNLYFVLVLVGLALPGALAYALTGSWTEALLGFFWGGLVLCDVHKLRLCGAVNPLSSDEFLS